MKDKKITFKDDSILFIKVKNKKKSNKKIPPPNFFLAYSK